MGSRRERVLRDHKGGPIQTAEFTVSENAKIYVRVKDETGEASMAVLRIYAGDTPPQMKIANPPNR